jgi:hypothetical protein
MPTTYAIPNGATAFAATTYTGTGSTQSVNNIVNGISFKPDFVWVKERTNNGFGHALFDSVRGAPARISSNLTEAENATGSFGQVSSFNSGGFTVATGSTSFGETGSNAYTYVAWNWKANGASVPNTNGTITSQLSANTTAGFSVVTYTGTGANATVGHGLGVAPKMIIVKDRSVSTNWAVYHSSLTSAAYVLLLNLTAAETSASTFWNSTAPTSSVFSIGTSTATNTASENYVAYCFAAVAGYSAFGSYTGNGSTTDGPFVYTGFRPRFVMIKDATNAATQWEMLDSSRNTSNIVNLRLLANLSNSESTENFIDLLSNGFKVRPAFSSTINTSGANLIYMAFAEVPFKYANAR